MRARTMFATLHYELGIGEPCSPRGNHIQCNGGLNGVSLRVLPACKQHLNPVSDASDLEITELGLECCFNAHTTPASPCCPACTYYHTVRTHTRTVILCASTLIQTNCFERPTALQANNLGPDVLIFQAGLEIPQVWGKPFVPQVRYVYEQARCLLCCPTHVLESTHKLTTTSPQCFRVRES